MLHKENSPIKAWNICAQKYVAGMHCMYKFLSHCETTWFCSIFFFFFLRIGNYCCFCGHLISWKWKTYHYRHCQMWNLRQLISLIYAFHIIREFKLPAKTNLFYSKILLMKSLLISKWKRQLCFSLTKTFTLLEIQYTFPKMFVS